MSPELIPNPLQTPLPVGSAGGLAGQNGIGYAKQEIGINTVNVLTGFEDY